MFKANFLGGLGRGDTGKIEYDFRGPVDFSYEREGEFGEVSMNISVDEDESSGAYILTIMGSLETEGADASISVHQTLGPPDADWF